jgi:hypothetical protein
MKRSSTLATAFALVALTGMLSLTTSTWARSPRQGSDRMTRMEEKIDALEQRASLRNLACLHDHMAELSEACRSALQGRRGDGRGP